MDATRKTKLWTKPSPPGVIAGTPESACDKTVSTCKINNQNITKCQNLVFIWNKSKDDSNLINIRI